jgi:hypothetical protein
MRWTSIALYLVLVSTAAAQVPEKFTNLQVLPKDIPRDSLINIMRRFSLSLEVRCQYCHKSTDNVSFKGVDFASDDKLSKRRARFMLRMVDSLNGVVMPKLPGLEGSALRIECKTCHRGWHRPLLLTQELAQVMDTGGIASAVARYKALREKESMEGRWDFGEWEMNLWSETLAAAGKDSQAIAMYELNLEYFPRSTSILSSLARLYEKSDRVKAISYWEQALSIEDVPQVRRRLDSLKALPR